MENLPRIEAADPSQAVGFCHSLAGLIDEVAVTYAESECKAPNRIWYGLASAARLIQNTLAHLGHRRGRRDSMSRKEFWWSVTFVVAGVCFLFVP